MNNFRRPSPKEKVRLLVAATAATTVGLGALAFNANSEPSTSQTSSLNGGASATPFRAATLGSNGTGNGEVKVTFGSGATVSEALTDLEAGEGIPATETSPNISNGNDDILQELEDAYPTVVGPMGLVQAGGSVELSPTRPVNYDQVRAADKRNGGSITFTPSE